MWINVRKNQVNNSKSKETYAFPKEERFRSTSRTLCDSFYNIPSYIGKSPKAGIGKGNKMPICQNKNTPSPHQYNLKSNFSQKMIGGKIGVGRQNLKYGGIFKKSQSPQPGRYTIQTNLLNLKKAATMKIKLKPLQPTYLKNPGPSHQESTLRASGKYIVSNVKNCPSYKIVNFKQYDVGKYKKFPGPGHYQDKQNLNRNGSYYNSKFENSRCRTFSKSNKNSCLISNEKIPGPGSYNYFSQFGAKE